MSEPENFIARWSRRKREPEPEATAAASVDAAEPELALEDTALAETPDASGDAEFDVSTLPPIESITARTDIRSFLATGVPQVMRKAALRRAWSADPAIRDFKGLAESDWDFNAPGSMNGFGPLQASGTLRRFVLGTMTGEEEPALETAQPPTPDATRPPAAETAPVDDAAADHVVATDGGRIEAQQDRPLDSTESQRSAPSSAADENMSDTFEISNLVRKRGHGGAIPR